MEHLRFLLVKGIAHGVPAAAGLEIWPYYNVSKDGKLCNALLYDEFVRFIKHAEPALFHSAEYRIPAEV